MVRPPAAVHISLTSVTHALSHIELMVGGVTEASGEAASWTTSPTVPPVRRPLVKAPTAAAGAAVAAAVAEASAMSTMPVIGVVEATAKTMHVNVRLNASANAAQRPRRDKRATWAAMGVDTRER